MIMWARFVKISTIGCIPSVKFESALTTRDWKMINSTVTPRLHYCHSLLYGINEYLVSQLQHCQNNAVCIVSLWWKYDHITPVLKELPWLPDEQMIIVRFCCWPTKFNMALLHLTCHHYHLLIILPGIYYLRANISWRHLIIVWKALASDALCRLPLPSGTCSLSPSSVLSPLTLSRAVWTHICLMLPIHNTTWHFIILCVFCQVSPGVWCLSDISAFEHGDLSLFQYTIIKTDIINKSKASIENSSPVYQTYTPAVLNLYHHTGRKLFIHDPKQHKENRLLRLKLSCWLSLIWYTSITYTLPAKNMEYFLFQRLFAFLWAEQGIFVLEILSYEQILLLEELIST